MACSALVRALVFDGAPGVREVPDASAVPGEALVRVALAGVCNTDVEITRGYLGFRGVLGHELLGVVEACDDPQWIGRRVVGEINLACGRCGSCDRGLRAHCDVRTVMGIRDRPGCFAERVALPLENLHVVPEEVPDELAVFVEPLAAAFEIVEQVRVEPGMATAVLGDGKLGLLAAMVLADAGAQVTVVGRHPRKLDIAAAAGCRVTCGDAAPARSFDVVVEATGAATGLTSAARLLRPRGTLVLKSTFHGSTALALAPIVVDEITLVGSRCGPFATALAALAQGRIDPRPLLDARYALADGVEAIAHAQAPGVLKVLLDPR